MANEIGTTEVNKKEGSGVHWFDLFLALIYSGALTLFVAWISGWEIPNAPDVLVKLMGNAWGWITSAAAATVISAIFKQQLSRLTLIWTVFLTVALVVAIYFLRIPHPIPPEHWQMTEDVGFTMDWDVKYSGDFFICKPQTGFPDDTRCIATGWGPLRAVSRINAPKDGNTCNFFGSVSGSTVSGTYVCGGNPPYSGPFPWHATIVRDQPTKPTQ
jgi:hypothetical protein